MSDLFDSNGPDTRGSFTFGTRLGLVFITQAAFVSLISVLVLLGYIATCAISVNTYASRRWSFSSPFHWYFLSLLISEIFTSIGSIMNLKWVMYAGVVENPFCTAQGIMKQLGDVGVALATLAIAFHTFAVLVCHWTPEHPEFIAMRTVCGIWVFLALNIGISAATHRGRTYWGNTQYWCWIKDDYPVQQIVLEYVFLFTAALVNILLYIPLAAVISGKVVFDGLKPQWATSSGAMRLVSRGNKGAKKVAKQMLFIPFVYTITTLPIAAARFSAFHGDGHVPFGATVFADVLFSLSGFFNVLLFWFTRRSLLPSRSRNDDDESLPRHRMAPQATANTISISLQSRHSQPDLTGLPTTNLTSSELQITSSTEHGLNGQSTWGTSEKTKDSHRTSVLSLGR